FVTLNTCRCSPTAHTKWPISLNCTKSNPYSGRCDRGTVLPVASLTSIPRPQLSRTSAYFPSEENANFSILFSPFGGRSTVVVLPVARSHERISPPSDANRTSVEFGPTGWHCALSLMFLSSFLASKSHATWPE